MKAPAIVALGAAAALSGCGPQAPERIHAMPTLSSDALTRSAAPPGAHLTYYGGKVIPAAQVEVIFWGQGVDPNVVNGIGGFYSSVPASPYFDWLSEYDTSSQQIGRGGLSGSVTINPTIATGTNVTDDQIRQELSAQISAGALPPPSPNLLYMSYFPSGVSLTNSSGSSCSSFCGYHSTFQQGGTDVYYGAIPDVATCAGACDFVAGDTFASATVVSSHETVEAITDPEIGLASALAPPLGWYDGQPQHGEIGDLCFNQVDTIAGYSVQKEWSNSVGDCITVNPAVPAPGSSSGGGGGGGGGHGCDVGGIAPGQPLSAGLLAGLSLLAGLLTRRRRG